MSADLKNLLMKFEYCDSPFIGKIYKMVPGSRFNALNISDESKKIKNIVYIKVKSVYQGIDPVYDDMNKFVEVDIASLNGIRSNSDFDHKDFRSAIFNSGLQEITDKNEIVKINLRYF